MVPGEVNSKAEAWGTLALVTTSKEGVSYRTAWKDRGWGSSLLFFWDDFNTDGILEECEPQPGTHMPMGSLAVKLELPPQGTDSITFLMCWHFPNRYTWTPAPSDGCCNDSPQEGDWIGNYYTTQYQDAWDVAVKVSHQIRKLEDQTIDFVNTLCNSSLPEEVKEAAPLFAAVIEAEAAEKPKPPDFIDAAVLDALPSRYRKAADQAVLLLQFIENHPEMNFAAVFNCLLGCIDEAARGLLLRRLKDAVPTSPADQRTWFEPYVGDADRRQQDFYRHMAQNLRKTVLYGNGTSPLGLLRSCMDYALNDDTKIGGVFDAVRAAFKVRGGRELLAIVQKMNDFRNTVVAHQDQELRDAKRAERELVVWIKGIHAIGQA